jgi:hypothetical protein
MFKKFQALGKAIKSIKPNVPETKIQKAIRDLKISTQKSKAGTAKLNQTIFELKNNKDFTFKSNKKKSESNTEAYKRITGENNKVIKNMLDKATEKKADGGRIGRKFGSPNPRKSNVQKIKETFGSKKNVPSKLKGFSKLPEKVQEQMNKKLARKV